MRSFFAACDLGEETGRVMLGTLDQGRLTLSEVRRFPNTPIREKDSLHWNIPDIYREVLAGLHAIGSYEEGLDGVSCTSWPGDYLLFDDEGSLITPAYHHRDPRSAEGMRKVLDRLSWETVYAETGVQQAPRNTLFQLGAEKGRRLSKAAHLLPVADAFNYLLSNVPRIELSQASAMQLYDPMAKTWSPRLLAALGLPQHLFPPVVPSGTDVGPLRADIAGKTSLEDARVVASCSHELAAALAGVPVENGQTWAFLRPGAWATMGVEVASPIITEASRQFNFTNEIGYGGAVRFSRQIPGLWILEECRRYWKERDREIDNSLLTHLAGSAPPFESFIDPADPRLHTPGDMPLKIQTICRETGQLVPRKPGPVIRCVLESLALHYRRTLTEIESLTGKTFSRLYLLGQTPTDLLNHFIANSVQRQVVVVPPDVVATGNVLVQALALGRIQSLAQAREISRNSLKPETLQPHAAAWDTAYSRLTGLFPR